VLLFWAGFGGVALLWAGLVLWAEGLGAVAASTAVTSVFAAARAPIPSARPKRTESILKV
jgi:hypothetical protein